MRTKLEGNQLSVFDVVVLEPAPSPAPKFVDEFADRKFQPGDLVVPTIKCGYRPAFSKLVCEVNRIGPMFGVKDLGDRVYATPSKYQGQILPWAFKPEELMLLVPTERKG